ncbi:MAG: TerB family tellurite resistance protein [Longimicrobiales bacterium]
MLDSVRAFFKQRMDPTPDPATSTSARAADIQRLHIAACALLLELAHADDEFTSAERSHIEAIMGRHFGLDDETARTLVELAEAEREQAIDLYQFTSLINRSYDLGQKTLLAEIMWGVILSDGEIARHEGYLLRKIGSLLDLKPGYLAQARRSAAANHN